jgi:acetate kinase
MGLTVLDGLPMGKRCGALDPGVVLHLILQERMSAADVEEVLYQRSGLLGLSGISDEMTDLLESDAAEAGEAVDYFVYRCQREIGSLVAALDGLDGLVFTGGIGENSPVVRSRICKGLSWLGVRSDETANEDGSRDFAASDSNVRLMRIPADEEMSLARGAMSVLSESGSG